MRLDPVRVMPGHGPRFRDVLTLAAETRRHHDRRADEILEIVRGLGEPTPNGLAMVLFPHLEDFTVMLGVSERSVISIYSKPMVELDG